MHRLTIITHAVWVSHDPLMYTIAGLILVCLIALAWLIVAALWSATTPARAWLGHHLQPVPEAVHVVEAGRGRPFDQGHEQYGAHPPVRRRGGSIASDVHTDRAPRVDETRIDELEQRAEWERDRLAAAARTSALTDACQRPGCGEYRAHHRPHCYSPTCGCTSFLDAEALAPKPAADPWPDATDRVMPARRVLPATTTMPVVPAAPVEPAATAPVVPEPKRGWLADHLDRPAKHEGATLTSVTPIAELAEADAEARKGLTPTEWLDGRRIVLDNGQVVGILETPPEGAILADVQQVLDPVGVALDAFRAGVSSEMVRFGHAMAKLNCHGYLVDEVPTETWDASALRAQIAAEDAAGVRDAA